MRADEESAVAPRMDWLGLRVTRMARNSANKACRTFPPTLGDGGVVGLVVAFGGSSEKPSGQSSRAGGGGLPMGFGFEGFSHKETPKRRKQHTNAHVWFWVASWGCGGGLRSGRIGGDSNILEV
jgi:hypothetical protein